MRKIDLGRTAAILANIGVLGGIILLAYELRQNSEALYIQAAQSHLNSSHEIDLLLAQDGELSRILLQSASERTDLEQFRYERFGNALLRSWQTSFYLNAQGVLDDDVWQGQIANISSLLHAQADLREFREKFRSDYTPRFNALLDELQSTSANE